MHLPLGDDEVVAYGIEVKKEITVTLTMNEKALRYIRDAVLQYQKTTPGDLSAGPLARQVISCLDEAYEGTR